MWKHILSEGTHKAVISTALFTIIATKRQDPAIRVTYNYPFTFFFEQQCNQMVQVALVVSFYHRRLINGDSQTIFVCFDKSSDSKA